MTKKLNTTRERCLSLKELYNAAQLKVSGTGILIDLQAN